MRYCIDTSKINWAQVIQVEVTRPTSGIKNKEENGIHIYLPPAIYVVSIPAHYSPTEVTPEDLIDDANICIMGELI